jgi:hypothetical protein
VSSPFQPASCSIFLSFGGSTDRPKKRAPPSPKRWRLTPDLRPATSWAVDPLVLPALGGALPPALVLGLGPRCLHRYAFVRYETCTALSSPSTIHQFLGRCCLTYCDTEGRINSSCCWPRPPSGPESTPQPAPANRLPASHATPLATWPQTPDGLRSRTRSPDFRNRDPAWMVQPASAERMSTCRH